MCHYIIDRVSSSNPALKDPDSNWVLDAKDKANLFSEKFSKKYGLRSEGHNEYYTDIATRGACRRQDSSIYKRSMQRRSWTIFGWTAALGLTFCRHEF